MGGGASGQTYLGKYRGTDVVIKQLDRNAANTNAYGDADVFKSMSKSRSPPSNNVTNSGSYTKARGGSRRNLEHEIHMLFKLRHPNIRLFMGAYVGARQRMRRVKSAVKTGLMNASVAVSTVSSRFPKEGPSPSGGEANGGSGGTHHTVIVEDEIHPRSSVYIVSEYMSRGTLYDVIMNPTIQLDTNMQVTFLRDIAQGMNFLHRQVPPVIHVDIKSKNMLLDERWMVKVADFGHSLILGNLGMKSSRIGTKYWAAPEVLSGEPNTTKSDVYGFAIVMWEVFARKEVYENMDEEETLEGIESGAVRPPIPGGCPDVIKRVMEKCWSQDPKERPAFSEILSDLQTWLDENPKVGMPLSANLQMQQSSNLINRMLPDHVAQALQEGRAVEPEFFDDCTM